MCHGWLGMATIFRQASGPWINIKMLSYQYRKSHCGDKTVVRLIFILNRGPGCNRPSSGILWTVKWYLIQWHLIMFHSLSTMLFIPLAQQSWVTLSVCPSDRLSVCGQNGVRSVSSTILARSISYLHIISTNFKRCVAFVKNFEILAISLNLHLHFVLCLCNVNIQSWFLAHVFIAATF